MASIFSKIISGEIPAYKILENESFLAFLNINPVAKGHCLVIPKLEIDYIFNIEEKLLSEMIIFSKKVALALENAIECKRVGLLVVGTEVPHAHIHLIPFSSEKQMSLAAPKLNFNDIQMKDIQQTIIKYL